MAILRKTPWLLIFFVVVGGLFGGLVAEILRAVAPTGPISRLFLENLTLGITTPITVNLYLLTVTFGATLKINLLSVIGVLMGVYIYRQAYRARFVTARLGARGRSENLGGAGDSVGGRALASHPVRLSQLLPTPTH